jgi:hypothetical protein
MDNSENSKNTCGMWVIKIELIRNVNLTTCNSDLSINNARE